VRDLLSFPPYALLADVTVPAERGRMLGRLLSSTNVGSYFGHVIGGGFTLATSDTQWCFWTLVVFGISSLLLIDWMLPETGRSVVGNGGVRPYGISRTWWNLLMDTSQKVLRHKHDLSASNFGKTRVGVLGFPDPLSAVRLTFYADTFLIMWPVAFLYCIPRYPSYLVSSMNTTYCALLCVFGPWL
jgi:hypothetical protein